MAAMKVAIRVRPSSKESAVQCDPHVGTHIKTNLNPAGLTFSTVLGAESTQREAYLECGLPMLEAALEGQRACLFAYGQTGSGKTFSLLGAEGGKNPHKLDGIVPQIVSELFRRFAQLESHGVKYNMWASFLEVHNEKARDLIFNGDPEYEQPVLYVPSAKEKGTTALDVINCVQERVRSSRGLSELIDAALARRVTDANSYNEHSSRSHALLTLRLERRSGRMSQTTSIHMVDLAGSECYNLKRPHNNINVSLLALGRVLTALANGHSHVPYRDSVLTRLLQGVIGEGGTTCMLACINPELANAGETHAVLEYAKVTAAIVGAVKTAEMKEVRDPNKSSQENDSIHGDGDPMENDEYDADDLLCRRTEYVETREFGRLYARCVGDAEKPLVLYLHSPEEGKSSHVFNDLVVGFAEAMRAKAQENAAENAKLEAAKGKEKGAKGGADGDAKEKAADRVGLSDRGKSSERDRSRERGKGAKQSDAKPAEAENAAVKHEEFELVAFDNPMVAENLRGSRPRGEPFRKAKAASRAPAKEKTRTPLAAAKPREGGSKGPSRSSSFSRESGKGPSRSSSFSRRRSLKGRAADSGDEGENQKGADDEEAHLAETHDNRFVHLRAQLSAALLRLQRELSQSRCEVCTLQLRHPFRMVGCRHLVCALCAESTVRYWNECPVCANNSSPAREDKLHAAVLQQREEDYWTQCTDTRPLAGREGVSMDAAWQSRLEIALKERERSTRAVLFYGCNLQTTEGDRMRITWFLRLQGEVQRGARSDFDAGTSPIESVSLHHSPSSVVPISDDQATLTAHNDSELGYTLSLDVKPRVNSPRGESAMCCDITIHWSSELSLAPIEVKVVAPNNQMPQFRRWLVVQFPMHHGRAPMKAVSPVQYGDGVKPYASGWVCYLSGKEARIYVGPRAFGRSTPGTKVVEPTSHNKPSGAPVAEVGKVEKAEKLFTLAPLKQHALGRLVDVQRELAISASAGVPLHRVAARMDDLQALEARIEAASLEAWIKSETGRGKYLWDVARRVNVQLASEKRDTSPEPAKAKANAFLDAIKGAMGRRGSGANLASQANDGAREGGGAAEKKANDTPLVATLLADVLKKKKMKPSELFKSWDDNGDGLIQREEFRMHLRLLGIAASNRDMDELFDTLDQDGTGTLQLTSIRQLPKKLQELMNQEGQDGDAILKKEVLTTSKEGKDGGSNAAAAAAAARAAAGPLSGILLVAASSGVDSNVVTIYEQMVNLVYRATAGTRERFIRQLPKADEVPDPVDACFHVCIDIPGYGRSVGNPKAIKETPAAVLSDVIRSLGKSHAYALVGMDQATPIIIKALFEKPSLSSYIVMREPDPSIDDENVLFKILQPTLVLCAVGPRLPFARKLTSALQQGKLVELPQPKGKEKESAASKELQSFFEEYNSQGNDPGVVGRKMPLLTRLAGGIRAWSSYHPIRTKEGEAKAKQLAQGRRGSVKPGKRRLLQEPELDTTASSKDSAEMSSHAELREGTSSEGVGADQWDADLVEGMHAAAPEQDSAEGECAGEAVSLASPDQAALSEQLARLHVDSSPGAQSDVAQLAPAPEGATEEDTRERSRSNSLPAAMVRGLEESDDLPPRTVLTARGGAADRQKRAPAASALSSAKEGERARPVSSSLPQHTPTSMSSTMPRAKPDKKNADGTPARRLKKRANTGKSN